MTLLTSTVPAGPRDRGDDSLPTLHNTNYSTLKPYFTTQSNRARIFALKEQIKDLTLKIWRGLVENSGVHPSVIHGLERRKEGLKKELTYRQLLDKGGVK